MKSYMTLKFTNDTERVIPYRQIKSSCTERCNLMNKKQVSYFIHLSDSMSDGKYARHQISEEQYLQYMDWLNKQDIDDYKEENEEITLDNTWDQFIDVMMDNDQLSIDYYTTTGMANASPSACRIIHNPTGLKIESFGERSRHKNLKIGLELLAPLVLMKLLQNCGKEE